MNSVVACSKRGVISIEAFPIHIISNLPDNKAEASPPSGKREDISFAGVFTGLTSMKSSHQSTSRERKAIEGFEKGKWGSVQVLDDQSPAANLMGVSEKLMSHPKAQSQMISEGSSGNPSQNHSLFTQKAGIYLMKDISSSINEVLSQLGLTQKEIDSLIAAKDFGHLKELLLKMGLNLNEAEQFASGNTSALKGEEGLSLFNNLMNALEQKGIPPSQAREISRMLVGLKMELLQIDRPVVAKEPSQYGIKELLLQLGVHPEEADKMIKQGEIPIDRLSKILVKLGISPEEVHRLFEAEELPFHNLKTFLIKIGINPQEADKLAELWNHSGKKMSIKQLVALYFQESDGKELSHLSQKGGSSASNDGKPQNSQGQVDLSSRGQADTNSIVNREVEGGKAQVDFEQVMSKMVPRESTAQKVMEQIVKGAKIQVESGQTRAKISLHPPALGKVQMYIITKENQVRVNFFAETPQVKEIIENNLPQLRQSLLQQGLKVEHFNVFVGHHPSGNQAERHNFFDSVKSHHLERKGMDGEDSLTMEKTVKRAIGNCMVDIFV